MCYIEVIKHNNNPVEKFFEFANAYKYSKMFIFFRICRQKYDETI